MEHTINHLEFTDPNEGVTFGKYLRTTNGLDGSSWSLTPEEDLEYYIKIVDTIYEYWGTQTMLHQFSHLQNKKFKQSEVPSVTFKYEFDPITMKYYWKNHTWQKMIVSLCAIVGGVFALSNFIHILVSFEK